MKFPESVFESLPRFNNKVKVSIQKIMKIFDPYSEVATSLADIVDENKWRFRSLVINPEKHSWYIIESYYWKSNEKAIPSKEKKDKLYWLKNNLYHHQLEGEEIVRSPTAWLNYRIMDTAQKSVYKKLGADNDYQSVLNVQKYQGAPYREVKNEHIQLMHDDSGHWQLAFCSNGRIQNCDSLKTSLSRVNRK